jgi:sphingomyelin phosphodiesterase
VGFKSSLFFTASLGLVCATTICTANATAQQTTSAVVPLALDIVSSNAMLLPSFVTDRWAQDFRGSLIGTSNYVKNRDVVVFQELFDNSASTILSNKMKAQYPHQTPVIGRSKSGWDDTQGAYSVFTPEDGGVSILSRWPITKKVQYIYDDSCGSDSFAAKGFAYTRLNVNGANVHIIGTHLQADDSACSAGEARRVRTSQLKQIGSFVDKLNVPSSEEIVYAGDMNIDRYGPDYSILLSSLNAATPSFTGAPYSADPITNSLAHTRYPGGPRQWLDYILFRNDHARPRTWRNTGLDVDSGAWTLGGHTYHDYSDHYPIEGS